MFTVMSEYTPVFGRIEYIIVENKEIQMNCKIFFYHWAKNMVVFQLGISPYTVHVRVERYYDIIYHDIEVSW